MAMDVTGLPSSHATGSRGKVTGSQNNTQQASSAASSQGQASETVQLSSKAHSLHQLEQEIAQLPDTDEQKVEELRAAISEGRYQIDTMSVASKMMQFEDLL